MNKKYQLDKVFISNVNEVTDEYVNYYEYQSLPQNILVENELIQGYIDIVSLNTVYDSSDYQFIIGDKFVNKKDVVPFSDFLKARGVVATKSLLTKREIFELYIKAIQQPELSNELVIIKPSAMSSLDKIIESIYQKDLKIKSYKIETFDINLLEEQCIDLLPSMFSQNLKDCLEQPVIVMILEGQNISEKLRKISIRGLDGDDIIIYNENLNKKDNNIKQKVK